MIGKSKVQAELGGLDHGDHGVPGTRDVAQDKGLADVTDLKNEDFIYVY